MKFKCYFCPKAYNTSCTCEQHMISSHIKERPFRCSVCKNIKKDYPGYGGLMRHYRKHHSHLYIKEMNRRSRKSKRNSKSDSHRCYFCNKSFKLACARNHHISSHTLELGYKCEFSSCTRRYNSRSIQLQHTRRCRFNPNQLKPKQFTCYFCTKTLTKMASCLTHIRSHTNEKPFKCQICSKRFTATAYLQRHKLFHHDIGKWWQCNFCEVKKVYYKDLNNHIRSKHTRENALQKCYFCSMHLAKVNPKHMSRHTGEKPYPCLHCPAEYVTSIFFQIHSLQHQDTPEFYAAKLFLSKVKNRCYFCQKPYANYFDLVIHMKKHTNEKSFKCKRCGLTVYSKSDVRKTCEKHTSQSYLYFIKGQKL